MPQPNLLGGIDLSFAYRNRATSPSSATPFASAVPYASPTTLDAALTTANAALYTSDYLSRMTLNDKIFSVRNILDPGTI